MWTVVTILGQVLWVQIVHLSKEPCIIILIRWEGILECCVFQMLWKEEIQNKDANVM